MKQEFDFLVIGSGIAGLSFALKASKHGSVAIVTKSTADESNTKYAQGGVAAVFQESDSFEDHIKDTLIAGDGLCDTAIVELVVKNGPSAIQEIIDYGVNFDKTSVGDYDLAKEGGHSAHRVLHHKDLTGLEIERTLLKEIAKKKNIHVFSHYFAVELITQHHLGIDLTKASENVECYGAYVLNTHSGAVEQMLSRVTIMAAGGAGHVYASTTNPLIATGDGVAMVYRAKGKVRNMEFIQFHPTALYNPGEAPAFLVSEAVRGFGAILRNHKGEDFVLTYDPRGSLAPRDVVARAIDAEMKKHGIDFVLLDATHLPKDQLIQHFPTIYAKCLSIGIDISKQMIPVVPAAHYMCGGVKVDEHGQTSIKRLYACGECASTGLHGANRLASNSLLEAVVFAEQIYQHASVSFSAHSFHQAIPAWNDDKTTQPNEMILVTHNTKEVQRVMSDYVGIVRSDYRLERAWSRLGFLFNETEAFYKETKLSVKLCELRNLIQVAYIIVKSAKMRSESRGLHYTTDFPRQQPNPIDTVF